MFIYGCPIFKWVALTWLRDRTPGWYHPQTGYRTTHPILLSRWDNEHAKRIATLSPPPPPPPPPPPQPQPLTPPPPPSIKRNCLTPLFKSPRSGVTLCFQFVSASSASAAAKIYPSHVKTVWAKPLIFGTKNIWVWGNVLDLDPRSRLWRRLAKTCLSAR